MLKSQIINAGLSLTNYLHTAFLEQPGTEPANQGNMGTKEAEQVENRPPNLLKTIFDIGRPYFRLDYMETMNNIRCLVLPIGKVKQLVPDLYIPSVSASTFMIASSILLCVKSKGKLAFGDALSKTLTKFILVNLSEIFLLSVLLYLVSLSNNPQSNEANAQQMANQVTAMELNQAYGPFAGYPNTFQSPGNHPNPVNYPNFATTQSTPQGKPRHSTLNYGIRVRLPEILFVIGYKYVLVNYFLFITTVIPLSVNMVVSMIYVSVSCLIFAIRSMKSLRSFQPGSSNPLIFIFPVAQPLFFYILLPSSKF